MEEKQLPCDGVQVRAALSCDNNAFIIQQQAEYAKKGKCNMSKARLIDICLTELRILREAV